ncbi:hypothetical protein [Burkholderia guangdongensis]|uniref:hypothetical protein n=1 Tax=Burkholderia guangdongensis TaxID=1792500 RepID=UPI0015CCA9D7|nr:hypothetical protein [Burkholderia guangdongensis]
MNDRSHFAPCRGRLHRFARAAIAVGIACVVLVVVFWPRGSSDGTLAVDLAGERCELTNMFVGDQLIRTYSACRPLATRDAGAPR